MRNLLSFSTRTNFLAFFAWVWVEAHFPLESLFINLIYTNHHLTHLQKCQHCGFSTLFNIIWKIFSSQSYLFLMDSQFFVDASSKSNSPYFLLNKNTNFSKNKTESKIQNATQNHMKNLASAHMRITNLN